MLNPVAISNIANTTRWKHSMPKCHRYNGTAVSVRTNVPIKNELVVQLTRLIGMRKIKAREFPEDQPVQVARPRITSSFFQACTPPQCAQVNLCVFSFAVDQRFSSIVLPVSVSFEVEGQRTSKLLILGPAFTFGRRGGSNRNLVGMSESINDSRLGGVVRRHLHSHAITDCKPNKTFAHLSGNVRENQMIVCKRDTKHSSRQHHCNGAL